MKCEHCGYEAPERAVICPECGEILPREKKEADAEKAEAKAAVSDSFSMPFLSSSGSQAMEQESEEDPREQAAQKQIQKNRLRRRIIGISAAALLVLLIVLYVVFLGGYKLAAYRYIKGVDYSSGSMYVALVPDSYMDYLETTYETDRREVKSKIKDYFKSWNKNYGNTGRMTYRIISHEAVNDCGALEDSLKTAYNITVDIKKAVTVQFDVNDGGDKQKEKATFVQIGARWYCMEAMEQINYICEYDGYNQW